MIVTQHREVNAGGRPPASRRPRRPVVAGLISVLAMLAVMAGFLQPAQALAGLRGVEAATITLNPPAATINGCETIQVGVRIQDVEGLYGADVRLSFDPSVLEVVDYDPGTPGVIELEPGGLLQPPLWTIRNAADNTAGTIEYAATQLNPTPPVNGSGVLFIVRFRAKAGTAASPLHFTYTKLANRHGEEIPATPADGSAAAIPPASPTVAISRLNSTTARLTWTSTPGIAEYHLYRATMPYFTPAAPPYVTTSGLAYDDVGALGDVVIQYYYVVRSACATGFESLNSNRVGAYDYALRSVASANYNDIAMVLHVAGVNSASSLATYAGSSVDSVSVYDRVNQVFQTYIVGLPFTDFPISIGDYVFLITDNTAPASTALVGGVPDPTTVSFSLVSGSPPRYNYVSLPLDRNDLTWASQVASDVGEGVDSVSKYLIESQIYQTYIPGLPFTDFPLVIGEPFVLILWSGAPVRWPVYPPGSTQVRGWNNVQD